MRTAANTAKMRKMLADVAPGKIINSKQSEKVSN
jgi:hypothetical protein